MSVSDHIDKQARKLYLELMKKCLLNLVYEDLNRTVPTVMGIRRLEEARTEGIEWPPSGRVHTLIGLKRLNNLQFCIESVLQNSVAGDFIEAGVWQGGAAIFMKAVLKAYEIADRIIWLADSFNGVPASHPELYPADEGYELDMVDELKVTANEVLNNFSRYDLLDENIHVLEGYFQDTLPFAPIEKLAILRLDGDLYESTIVALNTLYPRLSPGGFVIVDDFGALPPCCKAVLDYRKTHGITEPMLPVDWTGIYWQKQGTSNNL